ncbi:MAG: hypothetical protein KDI13_06775 [Alphaproteobacteria bacterium]|nr:hypothetical protein [Alphaproteobacteria bacterium]
MGDAKSGQDNSYQHSEIPGDVLAFISPNGAANTIKMSSVFDAGAYEAGTEIQRKALTALAILSKDPEARSDLQQAARGGYFMVMDDYFGGADNQTNFPMRTMSIVHDFSPNILVRDDAGHQTAASHVFIARHELRHINQPQDFQPLRLIAYQPLDAIKITNLTEADAQAEAVLYGFSEYERTKSPEILQGLDDEKYIFRAVTDRALVYYEKNSEAGLSDETVRARVRAEALLGWMSPFQEAHEDKNYHRTYTDGALKTYGTMLLAIENLERLIGERLDDYEEPPSEWSQDQIREYRQSFLTEILPEFDAHIVRALGGAYADLPLSPTPKTLDNDVLRALGKREYSENYFERTRDAYGADYNVFVHGTREQIEGYTGVTIDQHNLDELSALRERVAFMHQQNLERIQAVGGFAPAVENIHPDVGMGQGPSYAPLPR